MSVTSRRRFWAVAVADIRVADWYVATFDMDVVVRLDPAPDGSRVVVLRNDDFFIELKQRNDNGRKRSTADGYFKVGWVVRSIARTRERLILKGVEFSITELDQPEFGIRFCIFADPEGNMIQLFEETM